MSESHIEPKEGFDKFQLNELVEFFRRMDTQDLIVCKKVSKLWRGVIDNFVGVELSVGYYNSYIWDECEENDKDFQKIGALKANGVRSLYFSFSSDYEKSDGEELLQFKDPKVLRKLWIDGKPPEPYLITLFKECTNVKDLSIHLWSSALRSKLTLNFPFLQQFTISMFGVDKTARYIPRNAGKAEILIDFLGRVNTLSPCLKEIALQVPMDVLKVEILQFIIRHKDSLEKVKLQFEKGENQDAPNEQIQVFDAQALPQETVIDFEENNHLKECFLHCKASDQNHHSVAHLMEFFNNAKPSLTKLHLILGYQPLPETLISTSAQTLKFVELAVTTRHHTEPLNLSQFEQCKNLTKLKLMGPTIGTEAEEQVLPDLINLNDLPSGLRELCLMNLRIRKEDGNHISQLANLNQVVLSKIATQKNYGLLVEDAIKVITNPKLRWVKLSKAINGQSFSYEEFWQAHSDLEIAQAWLSQCVEEGLFLCFDEKYFPKPEEKDRPDPLIFTLENSALEDNEEEDVENNNQEEIDEEEDETETEDEDDEEIEEEGEEMEEDEEVDEGEEREEDEGVDEDEDGEEVDEDEDGEEVDEDEDGEEVDEDEDEEEVDEGEEETDDVSDENDSNDEDSED